MIDIILIVVLLTGFLIGKKIGFLKSIYMFVSFVISLFCVKIFTPLLMPFLIKTERYKSLVLKISEFFDLETTTNNLANNAQEELTNQFSYMEPFVKQILDNNEVNIYETFQIGTISDYISNALAYVVTYLGTSIFVFIATTIILWLIGILLKLFTKLPIISTIDSILGGILGLINTTIILFVLVLGINTFAFDSFAIKFNNMVSESFIAKYFFDILYIII